MAAFDPEGMKQRVPRPGRNVGQPRVAGKLVLADAHLVVELGCDGTERFLWVRSSLDDGQSFLLPIGYRPAIAGLSQHTRTGWFGGVCWALAFGGAGVPAGSTILFSSDTLHWRSEARRDATRLGDGYWVAAAEGVFATARLQTVTGTVAAGRLAGSW